MSVATGRIPGGAPISTEVVQRPLPIRGGETGGRGISTIDLNPERSNGTWRTTAFTGLVGGIGMHLLRPPFHRHPVYESPPLNIAWFAYTGGEGIFSSFLRMEEGWTDESPVIVTDPAAMPASNRIAGACLRDFLRLGCRVHYDVLPDLLATAIAGNTESIAHFQSDDYPEWVSARDKKHLRRLSKAFGLTPLDNVADHIAEWQRVCLPQVAPPRDAG